jgi:DNA-binding PadR family transcriptional regulator
MQASWPSENVLLGLLCERPKHAYELAREVRADEALDAIWRFERSEVYFLLGKLVQKGHIEPLTVEKASGPARTVYGPSETGHAALMAWLHTPEQHARNLRTSLLARVYIGLRLDPRAAVTLIDAQKRSLEEWLGRERHLSSNNEVVRLVHRLRAAQVEATLSALDELRQLAVSRLAARAETQSVDSGEADGPRKKNPP